ncbi:hypothetical protein ABFT80_26490, partial [Mesorhizobium sp. SB112]
LLESANKTFVPFCSPVYFTCGFTFLIACRVLRPGHPTTLPVVPINGTTDGSYNAVKTALRYISDLDVDLFDVVYPEKNAHVGSARRQAMDTASAWIGADRLGAILTTDAAAVPSPNWVESNLAAFRAGADLVGGRIIGNPVEEAMLALASSVAHV